MKVIDLPTIEAAIIARLQVPNRLSLSPEAAESLQAITFSRADKTRMNSLAAKAQAGALTPDEQAEAEAYSRIGSLLGILKSKARQSLLRRNGTSRKSQGSLSTHGRQKWSRHFRWNGPRLIGKTAAGRATVATLRINLDHRVAHRQMLIAEGLFPPTR